MVSPADQPIRYSTVEEITALFPLPLSKARLLLAKSMAAIEHGKSEPDGVAEREDRALWVLQGLEKMVRVFPESPFHFTDITTCRNRWMVS